ncbi:MAG: ATP-dependent Clp protease ATP-binding subunit, partial [Clostridia bacterium]|nr:ATP-dependent Clp protease ATP-binding subunit [Clostridia bacterium]
MAIRFTQKAQSVLNRALAYASELGHTYIGSEHILLGLSGESDSVAAGILSARGADFESIKDGIVKYAGVGTASNVSAADMTPRTKRIIELSSYEAMRLGQNYIGTEHLLLALISEKDCVGVKLLEECGVSLSDIANDLAAYFGTKNEKSSGIRGDMPRGNSGAQNGASSTLSSFGRDLTQLAKEGKIDPIIGRDKETERVIQILSRRTKNNPCLIGEPGVGKTAVVEGLAERIVDGNVPETLKDKKIVTLDIAGMIAGAKYRGEFEERMKSVMEEAQKDPNIILFIDEIHTLVGAGAAEGAVDAANILKPALARGEMQVIGATTVSEYRAHIEKDA